MRPSTRWLVALLLVGAAGAVLFALQRGDRGCGGAAADTNAPAPEPRAGAEAESAPPTLAPAAVRAEGEAPPPPPRTVGVTLQIEGEDGSHVARALVRLFADFEGVPDSRQTGLLGAWVLDLPRALPVPRPTLPDAFWIEVLRPQDERGRALPLGSALTGPHAGTADRIDVRLPAARTIRGRLLGADGRGLAGATVAALLDRGPAWAWETHAQALTREDGTFRIDGLREGDYRLEVHPIGPNCRPEVAAVRAGTDDVVLRCLPGVVVEVVFTDADGRAVSGMEVRVGETRSRGPGHGLSTDAGLAMTDADGRVAFDGLDPEARYILEVRIPFDRKDLVPWRSFQWTPESATIRLRRALQVRGRAEYPDGRPFPYASVIVTPAGEGLLGLDGGCDKGGRFVVDRVPEGKVEITAHRFRSEADNWISERVPAVAGDTDVVVRMLHDPIGVFAVRVRDWPGGAVATLEQQVWLTWEREDGRAGSSQPAPIETDGTVRFPRTNLRRAQTFYASTASGDRCAYARHLRAGDEPCEVDLRPAHSIVGRARAADAPEELRIYATGPGVTRTAVVLSDGTFTITGLPEGSWQVAAYAKIGSQRMSAKAQVEAGGSVELLLE